MSGFYKCKPTEQFWNHIEKCVSLIPQIQQQLNNQRWTPECELIFQQIEKRARALADIVKGKSYGTRR